MANSNYFDSTKPRAFAHRGFSHGLPGVDENSLEAFQAAIDQGAEFIETDTQASGDGVAVIFHDDDLLRLCGLAAKVHELSITELKMLSLPNGSRIPTLEEALLAFPAVKLNIDVKSKAAIIPTARAIENTNSHSRVLVSSFSDRRRRATLGLLSQRVATSGSMSTVLQIWLSHKLLGGLGLVFLTKSIDALQLPRNYGPLNFADRSFIERLQKLDTEIHFWTINDPLEMTELIQLGAAGIVTDRIDFASNL
ncbi:MAG: glycerophosphodiester phosphodiesterase family protein [Aquiluna sp.]|nr:glycerophosphodiester phosphodiesterase family protein [Aquiluna sp.]